MNKSFPGLPPKVNNSKFAPHIGWNGFTNGMTLVASYLNTREMQGGCITDATKHQLRYHAITVNPVVMYSRRLHVYKHDQWFWLGLCAAFQLHVRCNRLSRNDGDANNNSLTNFEDMHGHECVIAKKVSLQLLATQKNDMTGTMCQSTRYTKDGQS